MRRTLAVVVGAALCLGGLVSAEHAGPSPSPATSSIQLPLAFEANAGQASQEVRAVARVPGMTLAITPDEWHFRIGHGPARRNAQDRRIRQEHLQPSQDDVTYASLSMRLLGARPDAAVRFEDPLGGRVNYLIGQDRSKWVRNAGLFGSIRVIDAYDGIDVRMYGTDRLLEYDVLVKPGARLDAFRLRLDGEARVSINRNGEAEIALETRTLVQRAPVMYQDIDGVRKTVRGSYVLLDSRTLGFRADPYDAAHTLVVDPILTYGSYIGGTGDETVEAATTGPDGSLYLTGSTTSPALFGRTKPSNWGDVFVIKLLPGGAAVDFVTYLGGEQRRLRLRHHHRPARANRRRRSDRLLRLSSDQRARGFGIDRGIPRTPARGRIRRLQLDAGDRPGCRLWPQRRGRLEQRRLSRRTLLLFHVERPRTHSSAQRRERRLRRGHRARRDDELDDVHRRSAIRLLECHRHGRWSTLRHGRHRIIRLPRHRGRRGCDVRQQRHLRRVHELAVRHLVSSRHVLRAPGHQRHHHLRHVSRRQRR